MRTKCVQQHVFINCVCFLSFCDQFWVVDDIAHVGSKELCSDNIYVKFLFLLAVFL